MALTGAQVTVTSPRGPAVISLGLTKSGKRQGAAESVVVHVEDVCRRLFQWVQEKPKHSLIAGPAHKWRKQFADALEALAFDKWDFRPYSLRRGGATQSFSQHGAFDKLLVAGRWQSQKTAKIYVNQGLAVLVELKVVWTPFSKQLRRQYLRSLTAQLPPLEPVSPSSQARGRRKVQKRHQKNDAWGLHLLGSRPFLILGVAGSERKKPGILWLGVILGFGRDPLGVFLLWCVKWWFFLLLNSFLN